MLASGFDEAVIVAISRRLEPADGAPESTEALIVVDVDGDIDADTAPLLRATLISAVSGHPRVCCDLAGVTFFGAPGANALLAAVRRAEQVGSSFRVRGATPSTEQLLDTIHRNTNMAAPSTLAADTGHGRT